MDIVYKALVSFLSVILLLATGFSLTLSIANEIETNQYFTSVTRTLAESNYNELVISSLVDDAAEMGYVLSVKMHGSEKPGAMKYAHVTLNYQFRIELFGIEIDRMKQKIV